MTRDPDLVVRAFRRQRLRRAIAADPASTLWPLALGVLLAALCVAIVVGPGLVRQVAH